MLGGNKPRGYCLEMICADFMAGVALETRNDEMLLTALFRLIDALVPDQRSRLQQYLEVMVESNAQKAIAAKA